MMSKGLQDSYVSHGQLLFGDASKAGYVAKGYTVSLPSMENASNSYLNELENGMRSLMRSMQDARLQFAWSTGDDYQNHLLEYYQTTKSKVKNEWSKRQRSERFCRYSERKLRSDRLTIYITRSLDWKDVKGDIELLPKASAKSFEMFQNDLSHLVHNLGGEVTPLSEQGLFEEYYRLLSPATNLPSNFKFDPAKTVLENCLGGDASPIEKPDIGFYLDGYYHGVLSIQSMCQNTYMGIIQQLTGLAIHDYSVTVNASALDANAEIAKIQSQANQLRTALRKSSNIQMNSALAMKERKIARLMSNQIQPMNGQLIIRARSQNRDELQQKMSIIKSAILRMQSAQALECSFPTTARNFLRASQPGWSFDKYQDGTHYLEDTNLCHLLPLSGSNSDSLHQAEAIYDGGNGNLIGMSGFTSEGENASPAHIVCSGDTGSGKSNFLCDFISQVYSLYEFIVIVDFGLSYESLVRVLDPAVKPLIIEAKNNDVVFNYLDTRGKALTAEHLSDAIGVCSLMAHLEDGDPLKNILSRCLMQFYKDHSQDWMKANQGRFKELVSDAVLVEEIRKTEQTTWEAAATTFQNRVKTDSKLRDAVADSQIKDYRLREEAREELFRLSYTLMTPEEAPRHSDFQNWLELESLAGTTESENIVRLASDLKAWCADDGKHGNLLDGINTVSFDKSLIYVELGNIQDSSADLKEMASYIVTNYIQSAIASRSRSEKKLILIEELGAFFSIRGGAKIARNFYERSRKSNTCCISVAQSLVTLEHKEVVESMVSNASTGIFFQQSSESEIDFISSAFRLPQSSRDTLRSFNKPNAKTGAPFLLCKKSGSTPTILTACHIPHPEMLYLASSSGNQHEKRKADFNSSKELIDVVIDQAGE